MLPMVHRYQRIAWIWVQTVADRSEEARQTLTRALEELAQPSKLGYGGTVTMLRSRVQAALDALAPRTHA